MILRGKTARHLLLLVMAASFCAAPFQRAAEAAKKKPATEQEQIEASVKREKVIGDKVAKEIEKAMKFVEDPIVTARVQALFNRLTPWVDRPLPYSIHVVREKAPNAFCIPGGYIYVTTGLLDFVKSDAELAYVVAHELVHADGKHGIIQLERNQKLSLAALAVAIASKGAGAALVLSNVAAMAVSNAYSRDLERSADMGALKILENAGYPLTAAVTVMESLAEEELRQPWDDPGIALDHPKIAERVAYIIDSVKERGCKIQRKTVLNLLRPSLALEKDSLILRIDDTELFRGAKDQPGLRDYMEKAAAEIQGALQMETSPYDIRVAARYEGIPSLYVGITRIMSSPIPGVQANFDEIRARVLQALMEARKKHPVADYNG